MNISPSCMSTMALHHQASASSPAETEPFAGLHSVGISICDVGLRDDTYLGGQLVGELYILQCAKFGVLEGRKSAIWSQPFAYQMTRFKYDYWYWLLITDYWYWSEVACLPGRSPSPWRPPQVVGRRRRCRLCRAAKKIGKDNFESLFVVLVLWVSINFLKSGGEDDASYVEQLGRLVPF